MVKCFSICLFLSVIFLNSADALYYDFENQKQLDDWNVIQGTWSIIDAETLHTLRWQVLRPDCLYRALTEQP